MAPDPIICFDLGRVLVRICDDWQEALARAGFAHLTPARLDEAGRRALHDAVVDFELGRLALPAFAARTAPLFGVGVAEAEALTRAFLIGPYPGAEALVHELADAGLRLACLSNTNHAHWAQLSEGPAAIPLGRFAHPLASHLVGARKPDTAAYAALEEASGAAPEAIVFFDDLPANVAAAAARGWRAHRVEHPGDPIAQIRRTLAAAGLI